MIRLACRRDFPVTQILRQGSSIAKIRVQDCYVEVENRTPTEYREHPGCLFVTTVTKGGFQDWNWRYFPAGSPIVLFWNKRTHSGYVHFEVPPILPGPV